MQPSCRCHHGAAEDTPRGVHSGPGRRSPGRGEWPALCRTMLRAPAAPRPRAPAHPAALRPGGAHVPSGPGVCLLRDYLEGPAGRRQGDPLEVRRRVPRPAGRCRFARPLQQLHPARLCARQLQLPLQAPCCSKQAGQARVLCRAAPCIPSLPAASLAWAVGRPPRGTGRPPPPRRRPSRLSLVRCRSCTRSPPRPAPAACLPGPGLHPPEASPCRPFSSAPCWQA